MNIGGVIFMTWIAGEISVLIFQLNTASSFYQNEIDIMNTSMKNQNLSSELQGEIREYFLKV